MLKTNHFSNLRPPAQRLGPRWPRPKHVAFRCRNGSSFEKLNRESWEADGIMNVMGDS